MVNLSEIMISPETTLKSEFVDGRIKLAVKFDGSQLDAELSILIDPGLVLDAVAKQIPGTADDAVFALIKSAFLRG